jgi:hypothetical protein
LRVFRTRDAHPCRGEAACPLDMLESCMFPFVSPSIMPVSLLVRGRRVHPVWSSHVETHFIFSSLASARRHVLRDTSTRRSTSSQPRSELALLCISPFIPVLLLVRRARLPTSDDNLCRHHPYPHTRVHAWRLLSYHHSTDLERFAVCGAPVPRPHHPFVVPLSVRERRGHGICMMATSSKHLLFHSS